jgi:hypothetical protein
MARKQYNQYATAEPVAQAAGEPLNLRIKGLIQIDPDQFLFQLDGVQVTPLLLPFDDIVNSLKEMGWSEREAEQEADDFCRRIRIKQLSRVLAERIDL